MAATIETVLDAVVAALAVDTHAHVDLTGADQVQLGDPPDQLGPTGSKAHVYIVPGEMLATAGALRAWDETWTLTLFCYAQSSAAKVDDQTRAALRLVEDVITAVRSTFMTSGSVLNLGVREVVYRQTLGPMLDGAWALQVLEVQFVRSVVL